MKIPKTYQPILLALLLWFGIAHAYSAPEQTFPVEGKVYSFEHANASREGGRKDTYRLNLKIVKVLPSGWFYATSPDGDFGKWYNLNAFSQASEGKE